MYTYMYSSIICQYISNNIAYLNVLVITISYSSFDSTMVRPPEEKRVKFNLQDTVVTEDDHQQLQGESEHDSTALQLHGTGE